mmetsp:Transcript_8668/g.27290  ORF Transcript_8668/g.27290 Transcript_8668/m.27290 type:complete len:295 (+) Transcript_8668:11-895(+)|eukprot:CAMPEP_0196778304 /NCGR_PEP_ID=MMETSP1104-20130614/5717_1 /TAXON_ID=33652 /ORGANISM="Cafeteria sp., Strain Caron Lab Isolate" /LENGTH=294 /DNA_ID=CAMNT_0042148473 /DNA_START=11 /DNA_END=895 /DNA_ORIENTATION=-
MATRNLTAQFLKLRNERGGIRRPRPSGAVSDDKPLIGADSAGAGFDRSSLPPLWVDAVDAIHEDVDSIRRKMRQLEDLHKRRLMVSFDDTEMHADRDIDLMTRDITKTFRMAEEKLQRFSTRAPGVSDAESSVRKNIQRSLAQTLQQLSMAFRRSQKEYLTQLKSQKQGAGSVDILGADERKPVDTGFSDDQMLDLEMMEQHAEERDQEIQNIARSIEELAQVFKELAALVIDQGTILDRIDYNLEQAMERTNEGMKHLIKAEEHQKSARATKCIVFLIILIAIMTGIIIVRKS